MSYDHHLNSEVSEKALQVIGEASKLKAEGIKRDANGFPLNEDGTIDWEKTSEEKEAEKEKYERIERGSSKKPHKKHATNYTPPKKRRK